MENINENDLFNLTVDDFKEETKTTSSIFSPKPDNGKDGIYKAVVRFIPWHKDVKNSIRKKYSYFLEDPATGDKKMVDCPSNLGKKSILKDTWSKLYNSNSASDKKMAEKFKRSLKCASLVQIIKDENAPENVGKIMVWTFGVKIYDKINNEMHPEIGKPHIPYDLFEGKLFWVNVHEVTVGQQKFPNYDNCKFLEERVPISIDEKPMEKTPEDMKKIKEFLETHSPDLTAYDSKEWDENTTNFVNDVIKNTIPSGRILSNIEDSIQSKKKPEMEMAVAGIAVNEKTLPKSSDCFDNLDDLDDVNLDDMLKDI